MCKKQSRIPEDWIAVSCSVRTETVVRSVEVLSTERFCDCYIAFFYWCFLFFFFFKFDSFGSSTMANIKEPVQDNMESIIKSNVKSDIQKFYAGKTVFLTGSTGYIGKCLVEKLLRGCPDLKRLYVLVREKRATSPEERLKKYFNNVLFDPLREINADFASKVHLIEGDLIQDVALSEKDMEILIEEVNIIFHNASNVKFNEKLSKALKINAMGTQAMIDFAKQCKHIEGFMYVSTAYSHCYRKHIIEEAYPPPADLKMVKELIAADLASPTGISPAALKNLLDKYPNTYTFSKAIAEGLVHNAGKQVSFPCIVYRPSIVMSAWKEPLRGWCGNVNGPAMVFTAYGLGLLHAVCAKNCVHDFIPVDMSINAILVLMCDVVKHRPSTSGALVYNYGSSTEMPIKLTTFSDLGHEPGQRIKNPSTHMMWLNFYIRTECFWYSLILHILFHLIPAAIIDAYFVIKGKKPQGLSAIKKIITSYSALDYFINGGWTIDISKMNEVIDRMSLMDRELFFCDVRKLDWKDYCSEYWNGLRLYVLKEPLSTIPAGKRRYRKLEIAHYTLKYTTILLIAYVIVRFLGLL